MGPVFELHPSVALTKYPQASAPCHIALIDLADAHAYSGLRQAPVGPGVLSDVDALLMQVIPGPPYASKTKDSMHACGHERGSRFSRAIEGRSC